MVNIIGSEVRSVLAKTNNEGRIMKSKESYRLHEQEYRNELNSVRWEIEFILEFMNGYQSPQSVYPAIEDLKKRERLIKRALRKPTLLPIPDELRNPFTKTRPLAQREHIKKIIKSRGMRTRYTPVE